MATHPVPKPPLPFRLAYAIYAWPVFLLLAAATLPVLLVLPGLSRRRRLIRCAAATALRCIGMRVSVTGLRHLPHPCVVIANHESYLDGVALAAALPPHFGFVIKREMRSVPGAGWLLERIGAHFIHRGGESRGRHDTRKVLRRAERGEALVFFPEGTFHRTPGLLPFRDGAFVAAQRADLPVVPLIIRGTRQCLPPDTAYPWPGPIRLTVLEPLRVRHPGAAGRAELRDRARALFIEQLES